LLRRYRDRTSVVPQRQRAEQIEDQHLFRKRAL
jgi:hypothetical protein